MRSLPKPTLRFFTSVTSTMDVAREIILSGQPGPAGVESLSNGVFGVVAEEQTKGRGTSGRHWCSHKGNLLLTVCVPQRRVSSDLLPVFPLLVGLAVHAAVVKALPKAPKHDETDIAAAAASSYCGIRCKWPNDLVWRGRKFSGTLIETEGDFLLLGVGVNILVAPEVRDGGRPSTCLLDVAQAMGSATTPTAAELAVRVVEELTSSLHRHQSAAGQSSRDSVLQQYRAVMDWNLVLRRRPRLSQAPIATDPVLVGSEGFPATPVSASPLPLALSAHATLTSAAFDRSTEPVGDNEGIRSPQKRPVELRPHGTEFVVPVRLNEWGHLVVRPADDPTNSAEEETLFAEYLF